MTEEEEKKKKGIIAWFSKHKKGVTITTVGVALALLISIPSCNDLLNGKDDNSSDLPENPGYEDMDGDQSDKDTQIKIPGVQFPIIDSIIKKDCECTEGMSL